MADISPRTSRRGSPLPSREASDLAELRERLDRRIEETEADIRSYRRRLEKYTDERLSRESLSSSTQNLSGRPRTTTDPVMRELRASRRPFGQKFYNPISPGLTSLSASSQSSRVKYTYASIDSTTSSRQYVPRVQMAEGSFRASSAIASGRTSPSVYDGYSSRPLSPNRCSSPGLESVTSDYSATSMASNPDDELKDFLARREERKKKRKAMKDEMRRLRSGSQDGTQANPDDEQALEEIDEAIKKEKETLRMIKAMSFEMKEKESKSPISKSPSKVFDEELQPFSLSSRSNSKDEAKEEEVKEDYLLGEYKKTSKPASPTLKTSRSFSNEDSTSPFKETASLKKSVSFTMDQPTSVSQQATLSRSQSFEKHTAVIQQPTQQHHDQLHSLPKRKSSDSIRYETILEEADIQFPKESSPQPVVVESKVVAPESPKQTSRSPSPQPQPQTKPLSKSPSKSDAIVKSDTQESLPPPPPPYTSEPEPEPEPQPQPAAGPEVQSIPEPEPTPEPTHQEISTETEPEIEEAQIEIPAPPSPKVEIQQQLPLPQPIPVTSAPVSPPRRSTRFKHSDDFFIGGGFPTEMEVCTQTPPPIQSHTTQTDDLDPEPSHEQLAVQTQTIPPPRERKASIPRSTQTIEPEVDVKKEEPFNDTGVYVAEREEPPTSYERPTRQTTSSSSTSMEQQTNTDFSTQTISAPTVSSSPAKPTHPSPLQKRLSTRTNTIPEIPEAEEEEEEDDAPSSPSRVRASSASKRRPSRSLIQAWKDEASMREAELERTMDAAVLSNSQDLLADVVVKHVSFSSLPAVKRDEDYEEDEDDDEEEVETEVSGSEWEDQQPQSRYHRQEEEQEDSQESEQDSDQGHESQRFRADVQIEISQPPRNETITISNASVTRRRSTSLSTAVPTMTSLPPVNRPLPLRSRSASFGTGAISQVSQEQSVDLLNLLKDSLQLHSSIASPTSSNPITEEEWETGDESDRKQNSLNEREHARIRSGRVASLAETFENVARKTSLASQTPIARSRRPTADAQHQPQLALLSESHPPAPYHTRSRTGSVDMHMRRSPSLTSSLQPNFSMGTRTDSISSQHGSTHGVYTRSEAPTPSLEDSASSDILGSSLSRRGSVASLTKSFNAAAASNVEKPSSLSHSRRGSTDSIHRQSQSVSLPSPQQQQPQIPQISALRKSTRRQSMNEPREKYFIKIKGKRKMWSTRVPMELDSMSHGDVFVLQVPHLDGSAALYVWTGRDAGKVKRAKGQEIASRIRDKEWNNKAKIIPLDDDNFLSSDLQDFFTQLTRHSTLALPTLKTAAEGGTDEDFEREYESKISLYEKTESNTQFQSIHKGGLKLSCKMLCQNAVYVLDTSSEIYVWWGKWTSAEDREASEQFAETLLRLKKRPSCARICLERNGVESILFKEKFMDWNDGMALLAKEMKNVVIPEKSRYVYDRGGLDVPKKERIDVKEMFSPPATLAAWNREEGEATERPIVDNGAIDRSIWMMNGQEKVLLPPDHHGAFFSGETYIILYRYMTEGDKEENILYYWLGDDAPSTEQGYAAMEVIEMSKTHEARHIRVRQGKEPVHFFQVFDGKIVVRKGKQAGFHYTTKALFEVRGQERSLRVFQTNWALNSISSRGTFIINLKDKVYLWHGIGSNVAERRLGHKLCQTVFSYSRPVQIILEGEEPKGFWNKMAKLTDDDVPHPFVLPGRELFAKQVELGIHPNPRLFKISHIVHGNPSSEEIHNFAQTDLKETSIYILDAYSRIYVWIGIDAKGAYKDIKLALDTSLDYALHAQVKEPSRNLRREHVYLVQSGCEPLVFRAMFVAWDTKRYAGSASKWSLFTSSSSSSKHLKENGIPVVEFMEKFLNPVYSLDELKKFDNLPIGVDPLYVERYLSNKDFVKLFKMEREAFNALPLWKQTEMKKKVGLF